MASAKPKTPAAKKSSTGLATASTKAGSASKAPAKPKRPPAQPSQRSKAPVLPKPDAGAGSAGTTMAAVGPRFTALTPLVIESLLTAVAACGNLTQACNELRINRGTIYQMRQEDEAFKQRLNDALTVGYDSWEDAAAERAFKGYEKPVYQQGMQVGTVLEFSDTLASLLLKGSKPEKYKERISSEVSVNGRIALSLDKLSDEELSEMIDKKLMNIGVLSGSETKTR